MSRTLELRVDASRCTRCGACAALSPATFDVSGKAARVVGQPTAGERVAVEAARWICPTDAVRLVDTADGKDDSEPAVAPDNSPPREGDRPLFDELATGAERVRWALDDLPWQDLDAARAPLALREVVREMAFSENATYSATQRFLEAFCDDVDFSRWVAVWFYEETRHPYVLLEWLRRAGEPVASDFVVKGRVSTPFMRSIAGTLVTNVISEVTAAQAYRGLSNRSPEPVLGRLAALIAGDEARHAASFFRFARRRVAGAAGEGALRDRARGLEVLQAWLGGPRPSTHPVAQMMERLGGASAAGAPDLDSAATRTRVVRVIGLLLDVPLRRAEDVAPELRSMLERVRSDARGA